MRSLQIAALALAAASTTQHSRAADPPACIDTIGERVAACERVPLGKITRQLLRAGYDHKRKKRSDITELHFNVAVDDTAFSTVRITFHEDTAGRLPTCCPSEGKFIIPLHQGQLPMFRWMMDRKEKGGQITCQWTYTDSEDLTVANCEYSPG